MTHPEIQVNHIDLPWLWLAEVGTFGFYQNGYGSVWINRYYRTHSLSTAIGDKEYVRVYVGNLNVEEIKEACEQLIKDSQSQTELNKLSGVVESFKNSS